MLNLTAADSVSSFDLRINFSSPISATPTPGSLNYANNIFQGKGGIVLRWCVNDIVVNNTSNGCDSDDRFGQVHFSQVLLGQVIPGPIAGGLLFSVVFTVAGNGTSILTLDRANLFDPVDQNSSPNPHLITNLKMAAVFSNRGVVSFFNYEPTISPAFLPGETIVLDARGSFDADNASIAITSYSWDFGDGTPRQTTATPVYHHVFLSTGNYSVTLIVTDALGQTGSPITWTIPIVRPLGAIIVALRSASPQPLVNPVTVKIFNSTLPGVPFEQSSSTSDVSFIGLSPGTYTLTFSSSNVQNYSTTRSVSAGLTTPVTVYLTIIPPSQSYVGEIFFGSLAVAVAVVAGAILIKRVREKNDRASRSSQKRRLRSTSMARK